MSKFICKYFQKTIALGYICFSFTILFAIAELTGIHLSENGKGLLIIGWIGFCFISYRFLAAYNLFRQLPVRKPIIHEEQRLEKLLAQVFAKSKSAKKIHIRLRISEQTELNAFAMGRRTIAISKGLMERFSDELILGILAHELGHLEDGDTMTGTGYYMARQLPFPFYPPLKKKGERVPFPRRVLDLLYILLFGFMGIHAIFHHQNLLFLAVFLTWILYRKIQWAFDFLFRIAARSIEFRQDAYAHKLGFGKELLDALQGTLTSNPEPVNLYENMMKFNHPVIYNRIRRLEKLQGLR
jgi:heat shock protein HtpX